MTLTLLILAILCIAVVCELPVWLRYRRFLQISKRLHDAEYGYRAALAARLRGAA
jgi:hypothetical protein